MTPAHAKRIAEETLDAIKALKYTNPAGRTISLDKLVTPAVRRSRLYKPGWLLTKDCDKNESPEITVTMESTLQAGLRLQDLKPCVLNFASAKHPGGGFLRGSLAQEESIARSSALYHTLVEHPEMYEENKRSQAENIGLYLDYAIYSPDVPVIRNDRGDWLEQPYTMSVLTSPAPNRGAIVTSQTPDDDIAAIDLQIARTFFNRIRQVLGIMADNGHRTIVLGAWGCGVFGNDPALVSALFEAGLKQNPYFDKVVFAIYSDPGSSVYTTFDTVFGKRSV